MPLLVFKAQGQDCLAVYTAPGKNWMKLGTADSPGQTDTYWDKLNISKEMFCQWLTVVDWSFVIDITYFLYRNIVKDIINWKQMKWLLTDIMVVHSLKRMNWFNTLRPTQNGRHFADDMLKCLFLNENDWISIEISLRFVPNGSINNNPALFQIMAWRHPGDKPLSEPMMVSSLTHICVTRPQWVNGYQF